MRNYFSQLAKQSGLRIAEQGGKTQTVKESPAAPLHQEKVLLVVPDLPAGKAPESPSINRPKAKKSLAPPLPKHPAPTIAETVSAEIPVTEKIETEKPFRNESNFESSVQNQTEVLPGISLSEPRSIETPPVEQIDFKEPAASDAAETSESPKIINISEDQTAADVTPGPPGRQTYFKKTSEILEKGGTDRLEIQQILLQEVQQWAADTPEFPEAADEIVEAKQTVVKILPPPFAKETAVRHENFADRRGEEPDLEEQNFSLSIGSVSIVIEDTEKTPPPENVSAAKSSAENKSGEAGRPFSRLRRHYL